MAPVKAAVLLLGLVAAGTSPTVSAWTLTKDEVAATAVLADLLYSSPIEASMRGCVDAAGDKQRKALMSARQRVADLPTKSSQQRELDRIAGLQKEMMNRARADCMMIAASYLERINRSLATRPWSPDEVARTTADLSAAGLRDLATVLQSPDTSNAGASDNGLGSTFFHSLESCHAPDQLVVSREDVEDVWNASCRLIASIGLETPRGKPEFRQAVSSAPAENVQHQITLPVRKRSPAPEYPPASRRAGEEGAVQFRVYVLENGKPEEVQILKSSGFARLDEATVNGVLRNWWFVPGKENGKPVAMWSAHVATFRLTE